MIDKMTASEQMLKEVSKTIGFNQITMAQVSSLDLAEICWYEAQDQPGIKPIFALYLSKKFRLHVSRYLADERVLPYVQNIAAEDDYNFPRPMLPPVATTQSTEAVASSRNEYSYGVRVREMEEQTLLEYTMRISEKEFLDVFDREQLLNQQALADGLATAEGTSTKLKYTIRSADKTDPVLLQNLVQVQREIEEACMVQAQRNSKKPN